MPSNARTLLLLAAAWAAFYLAAFALGRWRRPQRIQAVPATPHLPADAPPPAVVGFVVNGRVDPDAATATLMDLAARKRIELYQPGDDPAETVVRVLDSSPDGLTPYERRVLQRVTASLEPDGSVPLRRLTDHHADDREVWTLEFGREVEADARGRQLCTPGGTGAWIGVELVIAVVLSCVTGRVIAGPLVGRALPDEPPEGADRVAVEVGLMAALLVLFLVILAVAIVALVLWLPLQPLRLTKQGRDLASHFLGVREWLHRHGEAFATLPPAAVAVWDRYLSFGAALGTTPVIARAADLAVGTRSVLWSNHNGRWREIRVRYPRTRVTYPPFSVLVNALLILALVAAATLVGWRWVDRVDPTIAGISGTVLVLVALRSIYRLLRAAGDRLAPVTMTGTVLSRSRLPFSVHAAKANAGATNPRNQRAAARISGDNAPVSVVIDDGHSDRARVWTVHPSPTRPPVKPGDVVRLRGYRWTGWVDRLEVLQPSPEPSEVDNR